MELFVVDENYLKAAAIENYQSLIWTERYTSMGDVTLVLPATPENRALITEGIFLHMSLSQEIMLIETISIEDNKITATGNTLVGFLQNRLFRSSWPAGTGSWALNNPSASNAIKNNIQLCLTPGSSITNGVILTSAQGTNEVFPKLTVGAEVPGPAYITAVPFGDLYTAIQSIAASDALGFRMRPTDLMSGSGNLLFEMYRGLDRTTTQSVNPPVVFDPQMDSLIGLKELRSLSGYKNVAWVWPSSITSQAQIGVAYAPGAAALTGFKRRTLMVEASDVNPADYSAPNLLLALKQRGYDALANNNYVKLVDGQIVPQNAFTFGLDYNLGDIIELRGVGDNAPQKARIAEYIRSTDSSGEKAYPTLSVVS